MHTIWTVGHSTHPIEVLIDMLGAYHLGLLVDVRRFPASRRHPQFNQTPLVASLATAGIQYLSLTELGGRRQPRPNSHNTAWRNESFRGYADYMETEAFRSGIERLLDVAIVGQVPTALMCSEAVWWRCHRALISDYLKSTGYQVIHILDSAHSEEHPYTSVARLVDGKLSYEGEQGLLPGIDNHNQPED